MKAKTKLTKLWAILLSLVMLLSLLPTTAFAAGSAETTDITEINLTGNYQYGTVPAGVLPAFNPATTTEGISIGTTNSDWSYFKNATSVWSGFGADTPVAYNDGTTKYGYRFQVRTNSGYQLASDLKVIYNGNDVTSTAEVSRRWAWGVYVTVDLGKAIGENPATHTVTFNSNGGTEIAPKEVVSGVKIKAPSTPTKDKYLFRGWYEDSTFSKKFDFNTPITDNITLYAKWEAANSINEIRLAGDFQYGTVPVGTLPSFNPRTTTDGISMGTNAGWSYFINETSVWSGFGSETPTAVNDGKTKYGYRFQVKTNDGYQLASDLKVIYNGEDVTSTVEVTRWSWGAYVTVDLGKATVESPATYDLTTSVNGGHGTISAGENGITEGASKIITFTPDSGYEIDKVMVNGTETTVTGNTLTVTMDGNKNVVVTYKAIEYTITVTDGKATVGAGTEITKAAEGTTVTLTANAAPTDMVFDKWEVISGSITLADANSATTTFTMPAGAVSVKATYTTYITVNLAAGEGSGTMEPIIIKNTYGYFSLTAPECTFTAPANKVFDKWQFSKDDSYLKPGDTKTIWSSADGATLTAIWKDVPVTEYDITVTDGKATVGAGTEITKAAEGTTVTLTANAAPTDMVFDKWEVISGSITLADANSATTTFTMPAGAVSVKATYKDAPHTHTYNQEIVKPEALKTPADCTGNAVYFKSCSCGAISTTDAFVAMNTALGHAYGSDWKYDSTNHWHECSRCHDKKYEAAHDYGSDNVCDTCGYNKTVPHTHNLTLVAAKAATCTTAGNSAYYTCEGCGKFYEDVLGTKEITDLASWGNIAKIAHTTKQTVTKATPTANGMIVNYCSVCKKTLSTTVIPKASSIKLKATSLTYNGKVRTPKVIVKDRTGKTLVKNTDYTVSYAKGRKYVGKYAVKITFKGKYSGTKTLYFTIKPKATSISSLTAGSKKFTVKWKKQATQTTGYQVQYSASSKFSKAKTVTVGKNTTVSKKISKLSGKKKYYVRVRTYKTVKINGKSIRIYSGWSKAKTVTTKK